MERKQWWGGTMAVEGARRSNLASWQVLLVPEPGNPCLEVPSTHEAGPAFLQAEQVVGTLGWLGCGHQAGQRSSTRTETADSTGWLQSHRAHKHRHLSFPVCMAAITHVGTQLHRYTSTNKGAFPHRPCPLGDKLRSVTL